MEELACGAAAPEVAPERTKPPEAEVGRQLVFGRESCHEGVINECLNQADTQGWRFANSWGDVMTAFDKKAD